MAQQEGQEDLSIWDDLLAGSAASIVVTPGVRTAYLPCVWHHQPVSLLSLAHAWLRSSADLPTLIYSRP